MYLLLVCIFYLKCKSAQLNTKQVSIPTWRRSPATKRKTSACTICLLRYLCCKECSSVRLGSNFCCLRHSQCPPPQIPRQCCNLNTCHDAGWWPTVSLGTTDQASTVLVRPNCYQRQDTKNGQQKLVLARHFSGARVGGVERNVYVSSYQLRNSLIRCHWPADAPNRRWLSSTPSSTRLLKLEEHGRKSFLFFVARSP